MRTPTLCLIAAGLFACSGDDPGTNPSAAATSEDERPISGHPDPELASHFKNAFVAGDVYFTGMPTAAESFTAARERGVTTVINILSEEERANRPSFDEAKVVRDLSMRYELIPVTPKSLSSKDVDRLDQLLSEAGGPVLIHCASANRCGGLWAAWLQQKRGMAVDDALAAGRTVGLTADSVAEAVKRVAGGG